MLHFSPILDEVYIPIQNDFAVLASCHIWTHSVLQEKNKIAR
jgi:hypothetical protein